MPYEFLDDVVTADMAFYTQGETLEETAVAAATAVVQVMVENLDALRSLTWSNTLIPQGLS
jgi:SHS2 domain-containing protein